MKSIPSQVCGNKFGIWCIGVGSVDGIEKNS